MSAIHPFPVAGPATVRQTAPAAALQGERLRRRALQLVSLLACLLLWHLAATRRVHPGLVTFANVPPPAEVVSAAWALLQSPKLLDRKLIDVARIFHFTPGKTVRRVMLPAAHPAILTGLRDGLSLAWMFMVAAELIAATRGFGYLLTDGRETGRADLVFAAIVLLALLCKLSDTLMQQIERRALAWRDTFDGLR